jgi:hypothetical protein
MRWTGTLRAPLLLNVLEFLERTVIAFIQRQALMVDFLGRIPLLEFRVCVTLAAPRAHDARL